MFAPFGQQRRPQQRTQPGNWMQGLDGGFTDQAGVSAAMPMPDVQHPPTNNLLLRGLRQQGSGGSEGRPSWLSGDAGAPQEGTGEDNNMFAAGGMLPPSAPVGQQGGQQPPWMQQSAMGGPAEQGGETPQDWQQFYDFAKGEMGSPVENQDDRPWYKRIGNLWSDQDANNNNSKNALLRDIGQQQFGPGSANQQGQV